MHKEWIALWSFALTPSFWAFRPCVGDAKTSLKVVAPPLEAMQPPLYSLGGPQSANRGTSWQSTSKLPKSLSTPKLSFHDHGRANQKSNH